MNKNIFAFTGAGINYPGFLSINEEDGKTSFSVRTDGNPNASIVYLPKEKLAELVNNLTIKLKD